MKSFKPFVDYIDKQPGWWQGSLDDYAERPAVAFLREAVHISDAINQCRRRFQRKGDDELNKDSQDSLYRLGAAALSSLMGQFETFQRSLFAGMMEATRFITGFDIDACCGRLTKDGIASLELHRVSAYRGQPAPVGQMIADNLPGWHNPKQVNAYFGALVPDYQFISKANGNHLAVLWQLRHAVVHTGGWLTRPDSQKIPELSRLASRPILLNEKFVEAAARRLHGIVGESTRGLGAKFIPKVPNSVPAVYRGQVRRLFEVVSPRNAWLP